MKFLNHKILLLIGFLSISVLNAQVISVTENDRGDTTKIKINAKQIIEINAKLEVSINKAELLKNIKGQYPQFGQQAGLDEKIDLFGRAITNQTKILGILENNMPSKDDKVQFYKMINSFLTIVTEDSTLTNRYDALDIEFEEMNPESVSVLERDTYIFSNLNNDLLQFKNELKTLEAQKYSISLLAFKKDDQGGDRVHVQNFDTYTERDYITVERWVVNLSDAQKKTLAELTEKAKENNEKALSIFEDLKQRFVASFPSVNCIGEQKDALSAYINDPDLTTELTDAIKTKANAIIGDVDKVISFIKGFNTNFGSWDITTPFALEDQFNTLIKLVNDVTLQFESFDDILLAISNIRTRTEALAGGFIGCFDALKKDFDRLKATIPLLLNQHKNYILNKDIGKEVIAFSTDNLPSKGYINLKGTGQRKNGDELLLEVVLRIPSSQEGLPEQTITLEQRNFVMQLLGVRSETAVGMILANPNDSFPDSDTDRKFYFAPSAALLLKFGSRKSHFYNEFLDFGVGVNFASPDFDTDGTPEFGLGLMATAFKDVLSVGYNYNVSLDSFYWYFGVNLPFNLPGIPVNPIKE